MTRRRLIAFVLTLLLLLASPAPSAAWTIPVYDYLNYILKTWSHYQAQAERARAVYYATQQYVTMLRNLESFGSRGSWSNLHGMLGAIDQLMNRAPENLGYLRLQLAELFNLSYPGYSPPPLDWIPVYQARLERARETYRLTLLALNRMTWNNTRSQTMIEDLQTASHQADGALEELEVANMWENLQTTEMNKNLQATMMVANVIALRNAHDLQREAEMQALRSEWLNSQTDPLPAGRSFGVVPTSWVWH